MGDQRKHYPFSASAAYRWTKCPASWGREQNAPPEKPRMSAMVGTAVHAMIEDRLSAERPLSVYGYGPLDSPINSLEGLSVLLDDHGDFVRFLKPTESSSERYTIPITSEMLQNAQLCINLVDSILSTRPDAQMWTEYKSVVIPDQMGGTADVVIVDNERGCIIDYKNGVHHVDVEDNLQLQSYAIGVGKSLPEAQGVKSWVLAIVQPNDFSDSTPVRTCVVTKEQLAETQGLLLQSVRACQSDDPAYDTGSWCGFCKGSYACPAQVRKLTKAISHEMPKLPDFGDRGAQPKPVAGLTDEQIGWAMVNLPVMRKHLDNLEKEGMRRMETGRHIPGVKRVRSRGRRVISDTEGLSNAADREGWDIWDKKIAPFKKLDREVPKEQLKKYVGRTLGKPTWAPESDKRPELKAENTDMPELPELEADQ